MSFLTVAMMLQYCKHCASYHCVRDILYTQESKCSEILLDINNAYPNLVENGNGS